MFNRMTLRFWAATNSPTRLQSERGASLVEYALLLALIAVVCVGAVSLLGQSTTGPYSELGSQLAR